MRAADKAVASPSGRERRRDGAGAFSSELEVSLIDVLSVCRGRAFVFTMLVALVTLVTHIHLVSRGAIGLPLT